MEPEDFRAGNGCPAFKFPPEQQFNIDRKEALKNFDSGLAYENQALSTKNAQLLLSAYDFFQKAFKKWLFIDITRYDGKPALLIEDYFSVAAVLFKMLKISKLEEDKSKAEDCFTQAKDLFSCYKRDLTYSQQIDLEISMEWVEEIRASSYTSVRFREPLPEGDDFQLNDEGACDANTALSTPKIVYLATPKTPSAEDIPPFDLSGESSRPVTPVVSRVSYGSCLESSRMADRLDRKGSFLDRSGDLNATRTIIFHKSEDEESSKRKRDEEDPKVPESPSKKRRFGSGL